MRTGAVTVAGVASAFGLLATDAARFRPAPLSRLHPLFGARFCPVQSMISSESTAAARATAEMDRLQTNREKTRRLLIKFDSRHLT